MQKITKRKKPRNDEIQINEFLLTQKDHKKWYYRGLMGNLGDNRGYIEEDKKRKSKKER